MAHEMHAIVVENVGKSPALQPLAVSPPGLGQVRIRVKACALNFADLLMGEGKYQDMPPFPVTLGMEISGEVLEIGTKVLGITVGDSVMGFCGSGGLAHEVVMDANRCLHRPESMDHNTAAAFQVAYGTSHLALDHVARLQAGDRLVVLGAGGGVGLTAVEIGAVMGAEVIAVARGADKLEAAKKAGAAHLIDTDTTEDLHAALMADGRTDVIYDAVGGALGEAALRTLRPEGRHLLIGFASGALPRLKPNHMLVKNIAVIGFYWAGYMKFRPDLVTDSLAQVADWHAQGKIHPKVSHVLPLERANEGLDLLRKRAAIGKIVITP